MKMIVAIIRNEYQEPLKTDLETLGIMDVTIIPVLDKELQNDVICDAYPEFTRQQKSGIQKYQQRGFLPDKESPVYHEPEITSEQEFIQKSMFMMIIIDENVHPIVQTFVHIHQSGRYGDGKLFVCPMATAIEIGNGDCGNSALS
ncbi:MAG: hypothetical protein CVV30_02670 [Methanomicrobiales archaeon HGW-Methanomicrobiales-1]|jgi:nitrogen regulatory protein PII 2|nr:MAG: hypothetical protein CVV30_02670 [Methanomicrobiales archaeon HGW-Methanomicrobiales-1]